MFRILLLGIVAMTPASLIAAEPVSATNFYVVQQETFDVGHGEVFWTEDNAGYFTVSEGFINSGFARCIGSGFGGPSGVRGDGICIYGQDADTFTMTWKIISFGVNSWEIVNGTGKYKGMTGKGTTKTRITSEFLKLPHRISDWEGEIELPNRN